MVPCLKEQSVREAVHRRPLAACPRWSGTLVACSERWRARRAPPPPEPATAGCARPGQPGRAVCDLEHMAPPAEISARTTPHLAGMPDPLGLSIVLTVPTAPPAVTRAVPGCDCDRISKWAGGRQPWAPGSGLSFGLIHPCPPPFTGVHGPPCPRSSGTVAAGGERWAQSSKACEGASLPWVQIPPPPPLTCDDVSPLCLLRGGGHRAGLSFGPQMVSVDRAEAPAAGWIGPELQPCTTGGHDLKGDPAGPSRRR